MIHQLGKKVFWFPTFSQDKRNYFWYLVWKTILQISSFLSVHLSLMRFCLYVYVLKYGASWTQFIWKVALPNKMNKFILLNIGKSHTKMRAGLGKWEQSMFLSLFILFREVLHEFKCVCVETRKCKENDVRFWSKKALIIDFLFFMNSWFKIGWKKKYVKIDCQ